jgi:hypothetical protein
VCTSAAKQQAEKSALRQQQRDQLGGQHDDERQQRHLQHQLRAIEHDPIGAANLIDDVDLVSARH